MKNNILFSLIIAIGLLLSNQSFGQATLSIQNITGAATGPVSVNVMANGITNMISFQFTIQYDQSKLTYQSLSNWYSGIAGVVTNNNAAQGTITFSYFNITPVNITTSSVFFTINFAYTSGLASITWTNTPTPINLMAQGGTQINPTLNNGSVNSGGSVPVITQHPVSQTKCVGESVSFSVTASGATGYQWKKNGVNVSTGTGGNSSTYTINPVSLSDAASSPGYTCVVSNANGQTTSNAATLTVNSIPSNPGTISGTVNTITGNSYTYSILAVPGATSYQWSYSGNGTITGSGTSISLLTNTSGTLSVLANNTCGNSQLSSTLSISVSSGTTFVISTSANPINAGTTTGDGSYTAGSSCTVTAVSNSCYTFSHWSENGNTISTASSFTFTVTQNRTLVANFVQGGVLDYTHSPTTYPSSACSSSNIVGEGCFNNTMTYYGSVIRLKGTTGSQLSLTFSKCDGSTLSSISDYFIKWGTSSNPAILVCGPDFEEVFPTGTSYTYLNSSPGFTGTRYYILVVLGSDGARRYSNVVTVNATGSSLPLPAGQISGLSTVCQTQQNVIYTVPTIANATSYMWTLPNGATGFSTTNTITVNFSSTSISGNITVKGINACGEGVSSFLYITMNSLPPQPAEITGNPTPCQGSTQVYSIAAVSGASSYTWSLPSGWNGTSTTTSLMVFAGSTSGNISVVANNTCGSGVARSLAVTPVSLPAQPGAISGNSTVCPGSTQTYSIPAVSGATSYNWTLPSGWTGSSTSTSITVTTNWFSGNISVTAVNTCGPGVARTLYVTSSEITGLFAVSGGGTFCEGGPGVEVGLDGSQQGLQYSLYKNGTNLISTVIGTGAYLSFGLQTAAGTYTIIATNPATGCSGICSGSAIVSVTPLVSQPGVITGPATVCQGSAQTFSIPAVTGATSYVWSIPAGWSGSSTSTSISLTPGSSGGTISVAAVNSCGAGIPRLLSVSIGTLPVQPGSISGISSNLCQGTVQTYSVTPVSGANSYNWTLPSGWSGSSTTNSIDITIGGSGGTIYVTANNGCGSSTPRSLSVSSVIPLVGQSASIAGNALPCEGSTVTYTAASVTGATTYTWTIPSGWSGSSTTNSIALTIGPNSGSISVTAGNTCGNGAPTTKSLSVSPLPAASSSITGTSSVTQGQSYTYTVPAITNASSYTWSYSGTGANINGTGNSVSIAFSATATSGNLTVKGHNACGDGIVSPSFPITVAAGGYVISGLVMYPNTNQTLMSGITVNLKNNIGTTLQTVTTGSGGTYLFTPVPNGNYTLQCSSSRPWAGSTSLDITLYKKHIATIQLLTGIFLNSGDVNNSTTLSTIDLTLIKNRIAGLSSTFTAGDWLFNSQPITIANSDINQNFNALCYGDANASNPLSSKSELSDISPENTGFVVPDEMQMVRVPLMINKKATIASITLKLDYPEQWIKPELVLVNGNEQDLFYADNNGSLTVLYSSLTPMHLRAGEELIWVDFRVNPEVSNMQYINPFTNCQVELGDEQDQVIVEPVLSHPLISFNTLSADVPGSILTQVNCYPNPFSDLLNVRYTLAETSNIKIELCDLMGRVLLECDPVQSVSGTHTTRLNTENLAAGSYLVRYQLNGKLSKTNKVSLVK